MAKNYPTSSARKMAMASLAGVALLLPMAVNAKPARHGVIESIQPDGTTLSIRLMGDEFAHRTFTEDGYLLINDAEGFATYAVMENGTIVSSGRRAVNAARRTAADKALLSTIDRESMATIMQEQDETGRAQRKASRARVAQSTPRRTTSQGISLLFDEKYPVVGSPKALVILVQYSDKAFDLADPHDYFSRMLSEPDFSDYGNNASCLDFFKAQSNNQFSPEFDVYGPVTLPKTRYYYGHNVGYYAQDAAPEEMVTDAMNILDPEVDFSQYDTDGDGYIDNVYVFYAGYGEADGGGATTVWPHSWNIPNGPSYDGVRVSRYACSNETDFTYKRPDGIGTFCHEFSHVMGLPDLYSTVYNSAFTPGEWSALDYGPYNNQGRTPPNYSIFERYALGWMEPKLFGGTGNFDVTFHPITDGDGYRVQDTNNNRNEFMLIEVRNKTGFDKYVPNSGMLVWRIDYDATAWTNNTVNNTASRQRVDIIEADNRKDDNSRAGDCFPGSANVTSFTTSTLPAFASRLGRPLNVQFTDIARGTDGKVTLVADVNLPGNDVPNYDGVSSAVGVVSDSELLGVTVTNRVVTVNSVAPVRVINMAGVTVATISAGGSIELPAGLYILSTDGAMCKLVVK